MKNVLQVTFDQWVKQGEELYGKSRLKWKLICPRCKTVITVEEYPEKVRDGAAGFSCIGRYVKDKGCDWSLGGLFTIHTKEVVTDDGNANPIFRFADEDQDSVGTIEAVRHPFEGITEWCDIPWPDWVPKDLIGQLEDFWGPSMGRKAKDWLRSIEEGEVPRFGAEVEKDGVKGKYVHRWNNIGAIVFPDGTWRVL